MQDIIDWLVEFETTASEFYDKAAIFFSSDPELEKLLKNLSNDEKYHAGIIKDASDYLLNTEPPPSFVCLDLASKKRMAGWIKECEELIGSGDLKKKELLEYIIKLEFSEWNTIFVYIANTFKNLSPEYALVPGKLREHKARIEKYIEGLAETEPASGELLKDVKSLPNLWSDRFLLVVDDEEMIVNLLRAILETKGVVESATNGAQALNMVKARHFDLIISDVNMPVMDGIAFYKEALADLPDIRERILFFTGGGDQEQIAFFREHGLRYILKPSPVDKIIKEVTDILMRVSSLERAVQ